MNDAGRRVVTVTLLVGAVVGAGVADRVVGRPVSPLTFGASPAGAPGAAMDVAVAPAGVESSAGYCPAATDPSGNAAMTVVLTNSTTAAVGGTITGVTSSGASAVAPVTVPAGGQADIQPSAPGNGADLAASVVLNGGGVGIWEEVSGPAGYSMAPCAAAPATHWYFAHGSTATGDVLTLALFNPGDAEAVVDVALDTSTAGYIEPPAYQGVEVPSGSLVVENIADHALNDPSVATAVTVLSGSVVAGELEQYGSSGQGGLSVMLGAPTAEPTWSFPYNVDEGGGTVVFHIFNPSPGAAHVTMDLALQQGSAEPLNVTVPGQSSAAVVAENQTRIPEGTAFAARFVASGGVGIVVDRQVAVSTSGAPSPQQGEASGVPLGGPAWLVPAEPPAADGTWSLSFVNFTSTVVTLRLSVLQGGRWVPLRGAAAPTTVAPGTVLVDGPQPGAPVGLVPLEVRASGALCVEMDSLPAGVPGVTVVPVLPLG